MGKYKFRLSDMIPNGWFYKLKDMNKSRNSKKQHHKILPPPTVAPPPNRPKPPLSDQRKSYHFTRDLNRSPNNNLTLHTSKTQQENPPEPPTARKSTTRRRRSTKRIRNYSVVSDSSFVDSVVSPDATTSSSDRENGSFLSCSTASYRRDIIIDMENPKQLDAKPDHKLDGFHNLPPIITKRKNINEERKQSVKASTCVKQHYKMATGLKLRTNSPRLAASRRIQARKSGSGLRSVSDSFVIVKSSDNPQRDFRESMVEMIVENNIRTSKDLEELLACYLSLNSDEYHDLIINVFKQIWFDIIDL